MEIHLHLKPTVDLTCPGAGKIRFARAGRVVLEFHDQHAAVVEAASALAAGDRSRTALDAQVLDRAGLNTLLAWHALVDECSDANLLDFPVEVDGRWLATVDPLVSGVEPPADGDVEVEPEVSQLSRFAYLRRDGTRTMLESPLARVRVELGAAAVAAVFDTEAERDPSAGSVGKPDRGARRAMFTLLDRWGFLEPPGSIEPPAMMTWEFHDALFHHASRLTHDGVGATYRLRDRLTPWPVRKPAGTGKHLVLPRPDLDALARTDPPLTAVMEARRSRRDRARPLTVAQLAEFLYRTLRISSVDRTESGEAVRRVIPAGGGLHELEAYLAVRECTGLRAGCYRYDSHAHALERLTADESIREALLDQAARSWGRRHPVPDVLITLSARVPRVAWTYEGMAYRVVLMNVGVAMEAMYLVATAMGLAPCAVGNGDPALFAKLTGLDPFEETSVGEFALSGSVRAASIPVRR